MTQQSLTRVSHFQLVHCKFNWMKVDRWMFWNRYSFFGQNISREWSHFDATFLTPGNTTHSHTTFWCVLKFFQSSHFFLFKYIAHFTFKAFKSESLISKRRLWFDKCYYCNLTRSLYISLYLQCLKARLYWWFIHINTHLKLMFEHCV